jgi:ferredoxin-thioredoxin reductase catalytic subunit
MSVFKKEYDVGVKRLWRCHVCNDLHYGAGPPLICPTCGASRAFVQVDRDEALKILGERGGALATTDEIIEAWKGFAKLGDEYKLVEDDEMVNGLAEGVLSNQKAHGLRYCPCRLAQGDFIQDLKLICPCNFQVQQTYVERGECWCGLFVKRDKQ